MLIKEIDEDMTPAEFRANELGMKVLGLLPRDINLKEMMVKVYSEEIAAFYDTKTKTMHLIKEPEAEANKPPTFLERLLGKTGGFDKDENKTVIAHELTHALADQNFNIDAMQKSVKQNDDQRPRPVGPDRGGSDPDDVRLPRWTTGTAASSARYPRRGSTGSSAC